MIINITKWKFIFIIFIIASLFFGFGFMVGLSKGVDSFVSYSIDKAFTILGENDTMLKQAIKNDFWKYKNHIGDDLCTLT